ncbi:MAG: hypothetical protein IPQ07_32655 [Myxococcales bacterium]|nr:hypothetical protein [Myxococcales bacterium]
MRSLHSAILALVAVVSLGACGPKRKNQCPGTTAGTCVNGEVCSMDRKRGCQICQCRPLNETNTGNDPDDPNPPVPVHD